MSKRCLVTGASGFLGRYLVSSLHQKGHPTMEIGRREVGDPCNPLAWKKVLVEAAPQVVFHLMGSLHGDFANANVVPLRALLTAIQDLNWRKCQIYTIGSAAEYGDVPLERQPIVETEPARPVSDYGLSKWEATQAALSFADEGFDVAVVRLFNVFGRGMSPAMMPAALIHRLAKANGELTIGPLDAVRDFLPAAVAMNALGELAERDVQAGAIINLCSSRGYRLREIAKAIVEASGRKVVLVENTSSSPRSGAVMHSVGNAGRLANILGFNPEPPELRDFAVFSQLFLQKPAE